MTGLGLNRISNFTETGTTPPVGVAQKILFVINCGPRQELQAGGKIFSEGKKKIPLRGEKLFDL